MLKCRDVPYRLAPETERDLSFRQRLSLRTHLLMCRHCRRFARQYRVMLRILDMREHPASDAEVARVIERVRAADSSAPTTPSPGEGFDQPT